MEQAAIIILLFSLSLLQQVQEPNEVKILSLFTCLLPKQLKT